jgi:hypothetical protein
MPYCESVTLSANRWRRGGFWFAQPGGVPARVLRGEACRGQGLYGWEGCVAEGVGFN